MVVSRKNCDYPWENLKRAWSRLSGPYCDNDYINNESWHRLYGRTFWKAWDINNKSFMKFKEV